MFEFFDGKKKRIFLTAKFPTLLENQLTCGGGFMLRQSFHPLLLVIFALAFLGIGVNLFSDPGGFFVRILVMVGVATLLYLLFKNFIMPRMMNSGYSQQYQGQGASARKASAGQKKNVFSTKNQKKAKQAKRKNSRPLIKRHSDVQLRVIEGKKNKSKKKNRALF